MCLDTEKVTGGDSRSAREVHTCVQTTESPLLVSVTVLQRVTHLKTRSGSIRTVYCIRCMGGWPRLVGSIK